MKMFADSASISSSVLSRQNSSSRLSSTGNIKLQQHQQLPKKPVKEEDYSQIINDINRKVKVGLRCRPIFQEEVDFAYRNGTNASVVNTLQNNYDDQMNDNSTLENISVMLTSGKIRQFKFDYVFGQNSQQSEVFDRMAQPIVDKVLQGYNGTIFAYGQSGSGKTYTMGILDSIHREDSGIIPRSIYSIFQYAEKKKDILNMKISLSFVQLYCETIQDLLSPVYRQQHLQRNDFDISKSSSNSSGSGGSSIGSTQGGLDTHLNIREDPLRGFYVEGLQEFIVTSYADAETLINMGLENRAIAPTLLNSTSSRSHTLLTLHIEQQQIVTHPSSSSSSSSFVNGTRSGGSGDNKINLRHGMSIIRSKLLMVDLAGSERVSRTVSSGTRLMEAKSINTSLSALGNVIAALSDQSQIQSHIISSSSNNNSNNNSRNNSRPPSRSSSRSRGTSHSIGIASNNTNTINSMNGLNNMNNIHDGYRDNSGTTTSNILNSVPSTFNFTTSTTKHIPYRDSRLTRLLQESLSSSQSTTALIATIGPSIMNLGETLSTLTFASRCMNVKGLMTLNPYNNNSNHSNSNSYNQQLLSSLYPHRNSFNNFNNNNSNNSNNSHHSNSEYEELCTLLQNRLSTIQYDLTAKFTQEKKMYQQTIDHLHTQLSTSTKMHASATATTTTDTAATSSSSSGRLLSSSRDSHSSVMSVGVEGLVNRLLTLQQSPTHNSNNNNSKNRKNKNKSNNNDNNNKGNNNSNNKSNNSNNNSNHNNTDKTDNNKHRHNRLAQEQEQEQENSEFDDDSMNDRGNDDDDDDDDDIKLHQLLHHPSSSSSSIASTSAKIDEVSFIGNSNWMIQSQQQMILSDCDNDDNNDDNDNTTNNTYNHHHHHHHHHHIHFANELMLVVDYTYQYLHNIHTQITQILYANHQQHQLHQQQYTALIHEDSILEKIRLSEIKLLEGQDTRSKSRHADNNKSGNSGNNNNSSSNHNNHHNNHHYLDPLTQSEALLRVDAAALLSSTSLSSSPNAVDQHNNHDHHHHNNNINNNNNNNNKNSNNNSHGIHDIPHSLPNHISSSSSSSSSSSTSTSFLKSASDYSTIADLATALTKLHQSVHTQLASLQNQMHLKEEAYHAMKLDYAASLVEGRRRDEEMVNWSCILKYLLASSSKLKRELEAASSRPYQHSSSNNSNNTRSNSNNINNTNNNSSSSSSSNSSDVDGRKEPLSTNRHSPDIESSSSSSSVVAQRGRSQDSRHHHQQQQQYEQQQQYQPERDDNTDILNVRIVIDGNSAFSLPAAATATTPPSNTFTNNTNNEHHNSNSTNNNIIINNSSSNIDSSNNTTHTTTNTNNTTIRSRSSRASSRIRQLTNLMNFSGLFPKPPASSASELIVPSPAAVTDTPLPSIIDVVVKKKEVKEEEVMKKKEVKEVKEGHDLVNDEKRGSGRGSDGRTNNANTTNNNNNSNNSNTNYITTTNNNNTATKRMNENRIDIENYLHQPSLQHQPHSNNTNSNINSNTNNNNNIKSSSSSSPSFGEVLVKSLSMSSKEEQEAMAVVNKVTYMTITQFNQLDEETQQQVLEFRNDLGLGPVM